MRKSRIPMFGKTKIQDYTVWKNQDTEFQSLEKQNTEWPSCMITSDDQISPPSLVCKQNFSHLHSFCVGILFNRTALGIHLCKTSQLCILKMRLGGEIYLSDVNMHKGYSNVWNQQNSEFL